jgi:hypothetical protein
MRDGNSNNSALLPSQVGIERTGHSRRIGHYRSSSRNSRHLPHRRCPGRTACGSHLGRCTDKVRCWRTAWPTPSSRYGGTKVTSSTEASAYSAGSSKWRQSDLSQMARLQGAAMSPGWLHARNFSTTASGVWQLWPLIRSPSVPQTMGTVPHVAGDAILHPPADQHRHRSHASGSTSSAAKKVQISGPFLSILAM